MYELVILIRDSNGNVMYDENGNPRKKLFTADNGSKLYDLWCRNSPKKNFKKKKSKAKPAAGKKEIDIALSEVEEYSLKVRKKRGRLEEDEEL